MKLLKPAAYFLVISLLSLSLASCDRDADLYVRKEYVKNDIPLTGALNFPPTASTALGKMNLHYNTTTKLLTYTISWSGLTGAVSGAAIHGLAPTGFAAAPVQNFSTSAIIRCASVTTTSCGSISGRLFADGVVVTEENILNGVYYVSIRTAANPMGEIRAQIRF
ncbi:MAG: CHRD domain-containing protein, partial [Sphingomonadales bacterium]